MPRQCHDELVPLFRVRGGRESLARGLPQPPLRDAHLQGHAAHRGRGHVQAPADGAEVGGELQRARLLGHVVRRAQEGLEATAMELEVL